VTDAKYFLKPKATAHKRYEALRAYYIDNLSQERAADRFGYTTNSFRALVRDFKQGRLDFFIEKSRGPTTRRTPHSVHEMIVELRKKNKSVYDICDILDEEGVHVSDATVRRILRSEGFARLSRRTDRERGITKKRSLLPEKARLLDFATLSPTTLKCQVAGIYSFIPYLLRLDLAGLVERSSLPGTSTIPALNHILSVLALKFIGGERLSHIDNYNLDRGFGLFAGLNVLPKATTMSTYTYGVDKQAIDAFMKDFVLKLRSLSDEDHDYYGGDTINLDFHVVPNCSEGEPSLEGNWSTTRNRNIRSALTFFAHDGDSTMLNYVNADIRRAEAPNEILRFVDHWLHVKGVMDQTLVFDSGLTNYDVLGQLHGEGIKFLTLRRRGAKIVEEAYAIPDGKWERVKLDIPKRKHTRFKAFQHTITLPKQDFEVNEIIIKEHGRPMPTFMITNNFDFTVTEAATLYARRWRIENTIAELVDFFSLNALSSPVAIRIHFDVLMTMVASTVYRLFVQDLRGYESIKARTAFSKFINSTGKVTVDGESIRVKMRKKAHTPVLKSNKVFREKWSVPWWGDRNLHYAWR